MITIRTDLEDSTSEELALLYLIREHNLDEIYKSVEAKGFLRNNKVTATGILEYRLGVKVRKTEINAIRELSIQFRNLFRGKKAGSMGTLEACMLNMKEFKEENDYSDSEILKAAQNYINVESRNGFEYLQRADRVIKHHERGVPVSKLLAYCDELENTNEDLDDWTETV